MKDFAWRFALIGGFTLAGSVAPLAARRRSSSSASTCRAGRSWSTRSNQEPPPGFKMDELVSALKKRADPEGVKEIPIRQIGSHRIEIILPQASPEEVEEVKKMLVDVGALEFRILANRKHDGDVMERALGPGGLTRPPSRYKWARLGEISTGDQPDRQGRGARGLRSRPGRRTCMPASDVFLTGKDAAGKEATDVVRIDRNGANSLTLERAHAAQDRRFLPDRVQPQPHPRCGTRTTRPPRT